MNSITCKHKGRSQTPGLICASLSLKMSFCKLYFECFVKLVLPKKKKKGKENMDFEDVNSTTHMGTRRRKIEKMFPE